MIPTALVLALVGGLVAPKRVVWVVATVTLFWVVLLVSDGSWDGRELLGGAALGALNAVVGAAAGWAIRKFVAR